MAPNKTILTLDALDEQTALELPDRELMCGCGGSLLNVGLGVGVSAGIGSTTASCSGGIATSGLNAGVAVGVGITTGSSSGCGS